MKRSSQVALVLMGVTGATAAGAYMLPRNECRQQPPAQQGVAVAPGAQPAVQQEPCRRSGSSSSSRGWHWYSSSSSRRGTQITSSGRPPNSTSVGFTSSNTSARTGTGTSSSSSSTSRGGFGSTGHAMSGGHSGS